MTTPRDLDALTKASAEHRAAQHRLADAAHSYAEFLKHGLRSTPPAPSPPTRSADLPRSYFFNPNRRA